MFCREGMKEDRGKNSGRFLSTSLGWMSGKREDGEKSKRNEMEIYKNDGMRSQEEEVGRSRNDRKEGGMTNKGVDAGM